MSYIIPVSLGELVDKITILEIKLTCITNEQALVNINNELHQLKQIPIPNGIDLSELTLVNKQLWDVEDLLRKYESEGYFGQYFIESARSVYKLNDKRAFIKKQINVMNNSLLVEEKSYTNVHIDSVKAILITSGE